MKPNKQSTKKELVPAQATETKAPLDITQAVSETMPSAEENTKELEKALESALLVEQPSIGEVKPLDLSGFASPKVIATKHRTRGGSGVISIIATERNGKRITLSHKINMHLNHPESVQIALSNEEMMIGENLPSIQGDYLLKPSGNKTVLYSSPLVEECIERYDLDYTDKTSITFYEAEYGMSSSGPFVSIKVK